MSVEIDGKMSMRPSASGVKSSGKILEVTSASNGLEWNDLSETEKSAASLGVSADHWKPISFLNTAHYETLLKANSIDESLAKKLEAFKNVASGSA